MSDVIDHPPHYTRSVIEPIDAIEAWGLGFNLGNVVKYVARAGHKGDRLEDLRKAAWYLARELGQVHQLRREASGPVCGMCGAEGGVRQVVKEPPYGAVGYYCPRCCP